MSKVMSGLASKHRRVNRSAQQWQAIMQAQQTSGLSQESFCRGQGLSTTSFAKWRKRFRDEGSSLAIAKVIRSEFVELPRAQRAEEPGLQVSAQAGIKLRLDLGAGIVLELTRL